jgi:hypothetical protein
MSVTRAETMSAVPTGDRSVEVAQAEPDAPQYLGYLDDRAAVATSSGVQEIACAHTIRLPEPARVILTVHRATRVPVPTGQCCYDRVELRRCRHSPCATPCRNPTCSAFIPSVDPNLTVWYGHSRLTVWRRR